MSAPFSPGDEVILEGVGECVVRQCFEAVGDWRVIAKGPWSRANVYGLYDFPASKARIPDIQIKGAA